MSAAERTAAQPGANGRDPLLDLADGQARKPEAVLRDAPDDRDELLRRISVALRLPERRRVTDVVRHGDEGDATFAVVLEDDTRVPTGTKRQTMDPRHHDGCWAADGQHEIPRFTPTEFRPIAVTLLRLARDADTGGKLEELVEWLVGLIDSPHYGADHRLPEVDLERADVDDRDPRDRHPREVEEGRGLPLGTALVFDLPIFRGSDRRLYVRVPKLRAYVRHEVKETISAQEIGILLSRLAFSRPRNREGMLAVETREGRTISRRYMASRPGWDPRA